MTFIEQNIQGVYLIRPSKIGDDRGHFFRSYCAKEMTPITHKQFVQMNISYNASKGTLRGLHFQKPPFSEQKIVRCIAGSIYDVFVDLRTSSSTFLKWGAVKLTAENADAIFLPEGIAHGFLTLQDHTTIHYSHSQYYHSQAEDGLRFNDSRLQIEWPFQPTIISERDLTHPFITNDFKGLTL